MVEIDILGVQRDGEDIVATVVVATDREEFIEYEFIAAHDPGGSTTVSGELFGTSGTFPGDSETHQIRVEDPSATSGTFTVEITEGGEGTDTFEWSETGNGVGPSDPSVNLRNILLLGAGGVGIVYAANRLRN